MSAATLTSSTALKSGLVLCILSLFFSLAAFIGGSSSSPSLVAQIAFVTVTSTANVNTYTPPSGFTSFKLTTFGVCFLTGGTNPKCKPSVSLATKSLSPTTLLADPATLANSQGILDPVDAASLLPVVFNAPSFVGLLLGSMALALAAAASFAVLLGQAQTIASPSIVAYLLSAASFFVTLSLLTTAIFALAINNLGHQFTPFQLTTTVSLYQPLFIFLSELFCLCSTWLAWRATILVKQEVEAFEDWDGENQEFQEYQAQPENSLSPFTMGRKVVPRQPIHRQQFVPLQDTGNNQISDPAYVGAGEYNYGAAPMRRN
ncbi:hypothetical protein HDU98_012284 [Podochytrium sp. JEL0797]|nr:hypothetical protein HDU98_012284 [Podochytrium sp. JEL0797]